MKSTMFVKFAGCLVLSAAFAVTANAQPVWEFVQSTRGDGNTTVEVMLNANDGSEESAAYSLTFTGEGGSEVVNIPGFGSAVGSYEAGKAANDFDANYSFDNDSWFDNKVGPLGLSLQLQAPAEAPNSLSGGFGADAAGGQKFLNGRIAHLVVSGQGFLNMVGSYARAGVDYTVNERVAIGGVVIPEPAAFARAAWASSASCVAVAEVCEGDSSRRAECTTIESRIG